MNKSCKACAQEDLICVVHGGVPFRGNLNLPLLHCKSCNHKWLQSTAEEQKVIEQVYSIEYAGFRNDDFFNKTIRYELQNRIGKMSPPPASLLDVGCGNGEFLSSATDFGYRCLGIDISTGGVQLALARVLNARNANFLDENFAEHFSLITMWDV